MYGTDPPLPPPTFDDGRINAGGAYRMACSQRVPHGILKRADDWWRINHPDTPFSGSRAPSPSIWFKQQLGLVTCNVISSHILRAHGKNRRKTPMPTDTTGTSNDVIVDYDGPSMNYPARGFYCPCGFT